MGHRYVDFIENNLYSFRKTYIINDGYGSFSNYRTYFQKCEILDLPYVINYGSNGSDVVVDSRFPLIFIKEQTKPVFNYQTFQTYFWPTRTVSETLLRRIRTVDLIHARSEKIDADGYVQHYDYQIRGAVFLTSDFKHIWMPKSAANFYLKKAK